MHDLVVCDGCSASAGRPRALQPVASTAVAHIRAHRLVLYLVMRRAPGALVHQALQGGPGGGAAQLSGLRAPTARHAARQDNDHDQEEWGGQGSRGNVVDIVRRAAHTGARPRRSQYRDGRLHIDQELTLGACLRCAPESSMRMVCTLTFSFLPPDPAYHVRGLVLSLTTKATEVNRQFLRLLRRRSAFRRAWQHNTRASPRVLSHDYAPSS